MRKLLLALLLCLSFLQAATAQEPARIEPADDHMPIQQYYFRAFFEEPWRAATAYRGICAEAAVVLVVDGLLVWVLWRRRRKT